MKGAYVKDLYWIPKSELDMKFVNENFTLVLNETIEEEEILYCYKEKTIKGIKFIGLPRGNPKLVRSALHKSSNFEHIKDLRSDVDAKFNLRFNGEYRDYQVKAIHAMAKANNGVLKAMPRTGKCVTGDTLVVTNTGLRRISEIEVDTLLSDDNNEFYLKPAYNISALTTKGMQPVKAVYTKANVDIYRVKTDQGYTINCTDDERFLVNGTWVKTKDLKVGDSLVLQKEQLNIQNQDLHYLNFNNLGFYNTVKLIGYLSNARRLPNKPGTNTQFIVSSGKSVIAHINRILEPLKFRKLFNWDDNILTISPYLSKELEYISSSRIPSWIISANTRVQVWFIKSLYEAQLRASNPVNLFKCCSPKQAIDIQILLLNLGVPTKRKGPRIYFFNARAFFELIGFHHNGIYNYKPDPIVEPKVVSVEYKGVDIVYDLSVGSTEDEHNFVANGFHVHNTVMGTGALAKLQKKTLILAHQTDLIEQFVNETINSTGNLFNGAESKTPVAGICKNLNDFKKYPICAATYQTFLSPNGQKLLNKIKDMFGVILVDEVHRTPAERYTQVISKFSAKRMYGLTATDDRKDLKYQIAELMIGGVFHKVDATSLPAKVKGTLCKYPNRNKPKTWNGMMNFLFNNEKRNKRIALSALHDVSRGHIVLIPVTQHKHAQSIASFIKLYSGNNDIVFLFTGQIPKNKRQWARDQMNNNKKIKIVIAMRSMLTGVNVPRWSIIYTIVPISNVPNYTQEIFRVCTPYPNKPHPEIRYFLDTELGASYGCLRTCMKTLADPNNNFTFCKSFKRLLAYKPSEDPKYRPYRSDEDFSEETVKSPHGSKKVAMRF